MWMHKFVILLVVLFLIFGVTFYLLIDSGVLESYKVQRALHIFERDTEEVEEEVEEELEKEVEEIEGTNEESNDETEQTIEATAENGEAAATE